MASTLTRPRRVLSLGLITVVAASAVVLPTTTALAGSGPQLISRDAEGLPAGGHTPELTPDGRFVAFITEAPLVASDTNRQGSDWGYDVYRHDRLTGQFLQASVASDGAQAAHGFSIDKVDISDDGRYLVFDSATTTLVTGDTNGADDIFVHDALLGTTTRASVSSLGLETESGASSSAAVISGDGTVVAFASGSSLLAPESLSAASLGEQIFVYR